MSENLRTSLLAPIALGKERGFLTRGELSDQLPDCDETSGAIGRALLWRWAADRLHAGSNQRAVRSDARAHPPNGIPGIAKVAQT